MNKFSHFTLQITISFIRMLIVAGITTLLLLIFLDRYLYSDYGVVNLIIIVMSYSFFPLFFPILFEVFFFEARKHKRKKHKMRTLYTNN